MHFDRPAAPTDAARAAAFWDREHREPQQGSWMEHPLVREAINRRVGGERPRWPFEWFADWCAGRTFRRALSIGCGAGALELELVRRGLCRSVDAFDVSLASVADARASAVREGAAGSIRYFVADFNRIPLPPGAWDLVLFHQSLHHVEALERLLAGVLVALDPEGVLFLDEYVGPSRTWWTPRRFRSVRRVYDALPAEARAARTLLLPIQADDPSEAIRSGEIVRTLRRGFTVAESRDYGGNLLAPIFPSLAPGPPEALIRWLIGEEERLLWSGAPSWYRLLVARPRRGLGRRIALIRYRLGELAHHLVPRRTLLALRTLIRRVWVAVDRRIRRKPIDDYV